MAMGEATGHSHRGSFEILGQITGAVPLSVIPTPRSRSADSNRGKIVETALTSWRTLGSIAVR